MTIVSDEKPSGDSVQMTVYSSDALHRWYGVAAILLGVIVAWILTVVLRNRINRDEMLLPVLPLRAALDDLQKRMASPSGRLFPANATEQKINDAEKALSDEALSAQGLPAKLPSPFSSSSVGASGAYRAYVQGWSEWVTDLGIIVSGIEAARKLYNGSDPNNPPAITDAVGKIDALSAGPSAPIPEQLLSDVNARISDLHNALHPPRITGASPIPKITMAEQYLRVEVNRMVYGAWAIIGLLTIAVGSFILIFSEKGVGFGTTADYFTCFFWGLGLPTGATLLQSTTSSVATTFNVAKP